MKPPRADEAQRQTLKSSGPFRDRAELLLAVLLLGALVLVTPRIAESDAVEYFSYLHSVLFDHDSRFYERVHVLLSRRSGWAAGVQGNVPRPGNAHRTQEQFRTHWDRAPLGSFLCAGSLGCAVGASARGNRVAGWSVTCLPLGGDHGVRGLCLDRTLSFVSSGASLRRRGGFLPCHRVPVVGDPGRLLHVRRTRHEPCRIVVRRGTFLYALAVGAIGLGGSVGGVGGLGGDSWPWFGSKMG